MSNVPFAAQMEELAAFFASKISVPTIGIGGGGMPIGATIPFDITNGAPLDWLVCDGTVYNIADYPQLAAWYESQHGSKNFYGGNGTTTFAVPDLRGEYIRGAGTNSHAGQGSGANVGVHQDATVHIETLPGANQVRAVAANVRNKDKEVGDINGYYVANATAYNPLGAYYTSRPTSTSYTWCVKAVCAGEVYSTDEREVGTWIDGKKIYQKTFNATTPTTTTETKIGEIASGAEIIEITGRVKVEQSGSPTIYAQVSSCYVDSTIRMDLFARDNEIKMSMSDASTWANGKAITVTVKYTKTT